MANNYPPRNMSEAERRRRAAARVKRKRQIRRNRIIFLVACILILGLLIFGVVQIVKMILHIQDKATPPDSTQQSSSQVLPESVPDDEPLASTEPTPTAVPDSGDEDEAWLLTLVNNNVPLPEGWSVNTEIAEPANQKELAAVAARAYQEMKGAAALDGVELLLCSGYRTVEYQQDLFDKQKKKHLDKGLTEEEAFAEAKKVVAVPGYSEHNSGLAADIVTPKHQTMDAAFAKTDAGVWLAENAHNFGFILRYPENKQAITGIIYEPWHFRYVGKENAKKIFESGKCLEEYLDENS